MRSAIYHSRECSSFTLAAFKTETRVSIMTLLAIRPVKARLQETIGFSRKCYRNFPRRPTKSALHWGRKAGSAWRNLAVEAPLQHRLNFPTDRLRATS
jgi:hypothetical protein